MFEIIIRPEGDLVDFNAWDDFADVLSKLVDTGDGALVLDLAKVNRMSSNFIGTIISGFKSSKEKGREFKVINVNSKLYELLEMLKLNEVMDIQPA
jgi:anti-anti-sigma factor